jgi:excinuclease ABC subunit C
MDLETFKSFQPTLPNEPGIYKFIGEEDKMLYVGKAKNLRSRVSSYFIQNKLTSSRLLLLTRKAVRIEYTIVKNEYDALLLENQLIKQLKPRYNILLRDDKTYPYICIKKEPFPRIFLTRRKIEDGSEYLGPYPSVARVRMVLEQLRLIFHIRTCKLNLNEKSIQDKKFKLCLEYHIGKCLGPCVGYESQIAYNETMRQVRNMLRANFSPVVSYLKGKMNEHAVALEFETAEAYRKKVALLEDFQSKSQVVNERITDVDVFAICDHEDVFFVNYLKVMNGAIIFTKTVSIQQKMEETREEILSYAIIELRQQFKSESPEIIVPFEIEQPYQNILLTVAKAGDKKGLLDIALKNALHFKAQHITENDAKRHLTREQRILEQMKSDLRLPSLPFHIECFDNSNIQGTNPVASCVVFKNAKPSKKDYRHFNIKTVEGPNDFASMEEVLYRRYKRLLDENEPLPDLIVIDGGKGQLSSALKPLEKLNLVGKISIVSIAKKLEEIYYPGDSVPLHINKKSESLKVLQNLRNEAHRFAITFHRQKRSINSLKSNLDTIDGIGEKSINALLKKFKSEKKIKTATLEELTQVIDSHKANIVFKHYQSSSSEAPLE